MTRAPAFDYATFNPWERLREISMFFERRDPVHQALRRLIRRLDKAEISYAVMGAMAVNMHGARRTTDDVDVLLAPEGLKQFRQTILPKFYRQVEDRPRRFLEKRSGVQLDILVTGLYPGTGAPGPIAFPDPARSSEKIKDINVISLPQLIQLKLAAGRYYDFGDVVNLIRTHNLDESFLKKIHASVHREFIECLEEKRREDAYEARQKRNP